MLCKVQVGWDGDSCINDGRGSADGMLEAGV